MSAGKTRFPPLRAGTTHTRTVGLDVVATALNPNDRVISRILN